ncbi:MULTISPECIES: hypothetical protein [Streptomyces]|uniref:Uncharacterized protein n=1 Tax=Streptomyces griseiscabiei TaxID=2993540 RepID=A0ABU4LFP9_9ACTN|nr:MULTISPECIES: hypothetical protein [Streptomyces]MBZ3908501.1 hypothetical protein [Streptomyces griseiscabiei]MDX2914019.1 hypothetical protein [Streptomyces griseiscabiei]
MHLDLESTVASLSVGDHVLATGADTRGHQVTRAGYLLAAPQRKTGQHGSGTQEGWLVYVGALEAVPERSNWVMLYPGTGHIARTPEPDMSQWRKTPLAETGASARSRNLRIMFGGKALRGAAEPTEETLVDVIYNTEGLYDLSIPDAGGRTHFQCRRGTVIWWAPLPAAKREEGE